ncbi:DNA-dependent metalloprotease SPRTN [Cololabis saira]|uniref:DNA-dependent metalloprotease SPRTN n=1 Tax=Cololabis saira TaxID=129043 RepID=UPI002AD408C7|nr:DNA-dependent metalloprotease SPRTN [Cololabis saira]
MDEDLLLALQLQEQFDEEYQTSLLPAARSEDEAGGHSSKRRRVEDGAGAGGGGGDLVPYWKPSPRHQRPLSIVDESWELLDPSPDVRAMFLEFNDTFFWGKLNGVEVKWSARMTLCAGLCSYEGRGGLCSIRLSEPLLKLRPRKDLVETLLHEMIHALLFVTQNNRDRSGHGPEFCKHMNRINTATGTNITIYHSFTDEVDLYRQHWWRCDGPCQNRKPYFGYVKRAMNRAPSSLDPWWEDHRRTCNGTYTKVKEPEGYGKKAKKDEKKAVGNKKPSSTAADSGLQDIRNIIPFTGKGFVLGGNSQSSKSSSTPHTPAVPVVKTSPKKSLPPASPAGGLNSPPRTALSGQTKRISNGFPSTRPAASAEGKPPARRSVANTRAFVNVNGSPVKIPQFHPRDGGPRPDKTKQKSIHDLFKNADLRKPESQSSNSDTQTKKYVPSSTNPAPSIFSKQQTSQGSPTKTTQSKYFSGSDSGAAGSSRKRTRDDRGSSASILDFFQKTLGSNSAATRESVQPKSPAGQQRTATTTAYPSTSTSVQSSGASSSGASSSGASSSGASSSGASSSGASSSGASSSYPSVLTVSCPVCQTKVQESKINEHLDSCLS